MADSKQVKAALAALADGEATRGADTNDQLVDQPAEYRTIIERASNATDDIDAAATFIQEVGVTTLETAVADAERELSGLAEEGRQALTAFKRFRAATDSSGAKRPHSWDDRKPTHTDHFHRGHDTSLGARGIRPDR